MARKVTPRKVSSIRPSAKVKRTRRVAAKSAAALNDASVNSAAAKIAEKQMPGWKAVTPSGPVRAYGVASRAQADATPMTKADAVMPSMKELHRKYYGDAAADAAGNAPPPSPMPDHLEVVELESGDLRKSVGVNKQTGKVEWSQG